MSIPTTPVENDANVSSSKHFHVWYYAWADGKVPTALLMVRPERTRRTR